MPMLEPWWTAPAGLLVLLLLAGLIFWAGRRYERALSLNAYGRGVANGRFMERLAAYQRQVRCAAWPVRRDTVQRQAQGWME